MTLTKQAIREIRARVGVGNYLRVSVDGGGCGGYQLALEKTGGPPTESDTILSEVALIDKSSKDILDGAELDFENSPFSQTFKLTPPPGANSCGCGSSFTKPE